MIRPASRAALPLLALLPFLAQCAPAPSSGTDVHTITLAVDAREAPRKILHARETIAVAPGPITLLYPEWIPGEHGPTGPVVDVAGLRISGPAGPLVWRRDLVNMYAIHCDGPAGVTALTVAFDFLLPPEASGFSSGASASPELLVLSWNQVVMYPSAPVPDQITVTPSLLLPAGWRYATALTAQPAAGDTLRFAPVSLTNLIDSPVQAGVHQRAIDMTPASGVRHTLNLVADNDADLAITDSNVAQYKRLVTEANALFGAHHYAHFDFLFTLSDQVAHFGLEHHQSNDDRVPANMLINPDMRVLNADLLPHEFVHSWNGKYRRPAGLATGDYSTPMQGDLLWVYEGLTQYLGKLLAARSGLFTPEQYREDQAMLAANLDNRPGRNWRPLQDVADEAQLLYSARTDWDSWRRAVDYYDEGDLLWMDADVTIRRLTNGKASLDDFCKKFHGGTSDTVRVVPYTLDDIITTLNAIAPNDWKTFFASRVQAITAHPPMGGLEGAGWKLAYSDKPTPMETSAEKVGSAVGGLRAGLGLIVGNDGTVIDVLPGYPADKSGLAPGMKILTVNGAKFSPAVMRAAVTASVHGSDAMVFHIDRASQPNTFSVHYHDGLRYPYLARDATRPDLLSTMIAPAVR
ncbi:MAG TPA: hypothetical protein VHW65_01300 [Gemmatimonadales bacterium]|nr:hypothetical protein [Gemmatimonadales bacterium]